jgi:hypothetical protein
MIFPPNNVEGCTFCSPRSVHPNVERATATARAMEAFFLGPAAGADANLAQPHDASPCDAHEDHPLAADRVSDANSDQSSAVESAASVPRKPVLSQAFQREFREAIASGATNEELAARFISPSGEPTD